VGTTRPQAHSEIISCGNAPQLSPIGNLEVTEGDTLTITVSALDPDGSQLVFSATGLPAFASLQDLGNGTATLRLQPTVGAHAGLYSAVSVSVSDGVESDSETFTISVTVPTVAGNSVDFSGDDRVVVGNDASLQLTGDMTFEMWLRPEGLGLRRNPLGKAYSGEGMITQEENGQLTFFQGEGGGNTAGYDWVRSSALTPGVWTHVALVRSGNTVSWYLNGVLNTSKTMTRTPSVSNLPLIIGSGYTNGWIGGIDEVAVYNRALTGGEVAAHFGAIGSPAAYGTLVMSHLPVSFWRLDESAGPLATDAAGSNDGTYQGTPGLNKQHCPCARVPRCAVWQIR
jgi:hypothetical protein